MDASTGKALDGVDHLRQSIADILSTPIGSRVARRDYGSLLPELIDQPMNGSGRLRLFAATAIALKRWEPRIKLTRVGVTSADVSGAFAITLEGKRTDVNGPNSFARLTLPLKGRGITAT